MTAEQVIDLLTARLATSGLDLVEPFAVQRYNAAVTGDLRLPDMGRRQTLGLLVACSRAMWPAFLATRPAGDDPVDRWVIAQVEHALTAPEGPRIQVATEVRYAPEPPPRRVAMQRLADLSGLAWLSPAHLNVHPVYGPWIALRAAIVFDLEAPPERLRPPADDPCGHCRRACVPRLEAALASAETADMEGVAANWQRWVAVRDACPLGREHRYSAQQLRYHYTKDRLLLDPSA